MRDPKTEKELTNPAGTPAWVQWGYRGLFNLGLGLSAPYYARRMARRGGWKDRLGQRFGRYDNSFIQRCHGQTNLWFHAVSVGEVLLSVPLVKRLENKLPSVQWILSATTTTGMAQWHQQMPGPPATCFYPIDRRPWVRQSMEVIRPKAIILSEAEIWPNFLWEAFDRRIPVFLINARISEKSYLRYHRFRSIFAPLFGSLSGVGTQNDSDAQRLMALGCDFSKVFVTGNMKFDAALGSQSRPSTLDIPALLRAHDMHEKTLLLGSSTHAGEEAMLADLYLKLRQSHPQLRLVIVPRHFERGSQIATALRSKELSVACRSEWSDASEDSREKPSDVLILDSTGELASLYPHVDLVFIGKSMLARGGQSPLEAASAGKPILMGPHMQNFRAITRTFLEKQAARQVGDVASLQTTLTELLEHPQERDRLGKAARDVVDANLGAVERTLEMLCQHPSIAEHLTP